jgi:glucan-binding YG repeat protein
VRFNGDEVKALHYLRIQDLKKLLLILFIALGGVYSSYKLMGGSENGAEDQKDRQVQSQKDLKMYKKLEFVDEKAVKEKLEASLPPKAPEKTSVPAAPVQTRKTNSVAQPRVKQEHADQRPTAEPDAESILKMSGSSHAKKPALIAVPNSSAPQKEPVAAPAKPATPPPYQKVKSRTVQEAENAVKD